ncbi:hypothetical protein CAEBREN_29483 [Caenorhabditis brenneri]|uniref:DUF7154 domain-containing protein n=1 Tax=Caenorhabditis brenneri TaxID=135651 RepID=G0P762_CAEBE|nr:hypothetical protein CAEBREN_29483 [Caenorhabditis brenneri]
MNGGYWNQLGTGIVNYFQLSGNVEYKWSIDYHYSSNTSQIIEHRVYGSFYHDFLPFIN